MQENVKALQQDLALADSKAEHWANRVTELNLRMSMKDDAVRDLFEKHIENCRRNITLYKKGTTECKLHQMLIDKLIDLKNEFPYK